jgi:hypothetical protein
MAARKTAKPRKRPAATKPKVDLSKTMAKLSAEDREGVLSGAEQLLRSLVTAPRVRPGTELPEDSEAVPADVAELFEQFLVDLRAGVEKTRH